MPIRLPHYRWWITLYAVLIGALLARQGYLAILPARAWVDRGWQAMASRHDYTAAEDNFTRARRKDPTGDLPRIALWSLYSLETTQPHCPRFAAWEGVPLLGEYLAARDAAYRRGRVALAKQWLAGAEAERLHRRYGHCAVDAIFANCWRRDSHACEETFLAITDSVDGNYPQTWTRLSRLEHDVPTTYDAIMQAAPTLVFRHAQAAWRTGHLNKAQALFGIASSGVTLVSHQQLLLLAACCHNLMLNSLQPAVPARTWALSGGVLTEVPSLELVDHATFVAAPAREGAHLLLFSERQAFLHWWQWEGTDWRKRAASDESLLTAQLQQLTQHASGYANWPLRAFSAWSDRHAYLGMNGTLRKINNRRQMVEKGINLLLRLDGAAESMDAPASDLACIAPDLWVRQDDAFMRLQPDQPAVQYLGKSVTRLQEIFGRPEKLPPSALWLNPDWRYAHDGAGRLWLVSWEGHRLLLRAAWTGAAFRPPTPEEQAAVAEGFLDATGRLWRTMELPAGFRRDAWRTVTGLPEETEAASYAVDRRGRVWMTTANGIAACWQGTLWRSVANRLPAWGALRAPIAVGDGVLVVVNDLGVCYLE